MKKDETINSVSSLLLSAFVSVRFLPVRAALATSLYSMNGASDYRSSNVE